MGGRLGITWKEFDLEQFRRGMVVELEHGLHDPVTNVTDDDLFLTAKTALAHLNEFPTTTTGSRRRRRPTGRNGERHSD